MNEQSERVGGSPDSKKKLPNSENLKPTEQNQIYKRALATPGARLGVIECVNHYLLQAYPVLHERAGERVAQLKTTVLLMPNGSDRITGAPLQAHETEKKVEDELVKKLLATSLKPKKKKPAAAKAAAPAAAAAATAAVKHSA